MCGLVGMAGMLEHKHRLAMKELLYLNTLRGKDSTGLSVIDRDRGIRTRKYAVPGYEFIEFPQVDKIMSHADQVWIGHNRFRTTGLVNKANAHPFEVVDDDGDVLLVGAHNGTLENKYEIERELDGVRFDTDSEALFNLLADQATYKEAIAKLRGAWSLVWWDAYTDSIHFCRNDQRPLVYAFQKDRKVIIWASEAWMLLAACRRNGIELAANDKGMSCWATVVDHLYTLEIPQERDKELPELKREGGFSGAPKRGFQFGYSGQGAAHSPWWDDDPNWDEDLVKKAAEETSEKGKTTSEKTGEVVTLGAPHCRGYKGESISKENLDKILKKGCVWNGCEIKNVYAFVDPTAVVCGRCMHDMHPKDGDRVPADDQTNSPEYRKVIDAAIGSAKKAVG